MSTGTTIAPLILPEPIAADLNDVAVTIMLTYTLTPTVSIPDGLSFDAATRTLSGTPATLMTMPVSLTYTASNSSSALNFQSTSASLTFSVTVAETGVGSVRHYSDATATTPITELVSSGEIYSVVVFGANVTNVNATATDTNAQPAIAYTLGGTAVPFGIVAHDAALLESGNCQATDATNTRRYTCRYSVSGANVAATDPGTVHRVGIRCHRQGKQHMDLTPYGADTGVTIGVRPDGVVW